MKRKEILQERFIKNKRPLNLTHVSLIKEKQPKTKTIRKVILMSQFNDDDERDFAEEVEKTRGYCNEGYY